MPAPARTLTTAERAKVLAVLHEPRFADQPPREIYATLLDEGRYVASIRTMYRILKAAGEGGERRAQRGPRACPTPSLQATAPNQVWTWDITKLPTYTRGDFLNLYVILDLWSRYVVGWMVAGRETSALAQHLFATAITRYEIAPDQLLVHQDRGAPMTAHGFTGLLGELGVRRSYSRPRISNDNPYSESHFKTLKYQPDYPGRFVGTRDACPWLADFFAWYCYRHRHEGLGLFTPADCFFGRVPELATQRQAVLDAAYDAQPARFVRGRPRVSLPPRVVAINPPAPEVVLTGAEILTSPEALAPRPAVAEVPPAVILPGLLPASLSPAAEGLS
jgi:putative transposase